MNSRGSTSPLASDEHAQLDLLDHGSPDQQTDRDTDAVATDWLGERYTGSEGEHERVARDTTAPTEAPTIIGSAHGPRLLEALMTNGPTATRR